MGISIEVDSIITPAERHAYGPPNYQHFQRETVKRLCQVFDWQWVPWEEPSPIRGQTDTVCDASRFYVLLGVARAHARGTALRLFNEEQTINQTADEQRLFPHLLGRAPWTNYYLPVDFDTPRFFESAWGTASAGSVLHLSRELTELEPVIRNHRNRFGHEAPVEAYLSQSSTYHTWGDIYELCHILLGATQESIDLNLPLRLKG